MLFRSVIMLITLVTFHGLEKRFYDTGKTERRYIRIIVKKNMDGIPKVLDYLQKNNVKTRTLNIKEDIAGNTITAEFYLKIMRDGNIDGIITDMQKIDSVISIENIG